jgi:phosphoserine phosphatase
VYTNRIFFDGIGRLASWQATPFDGHGKPAALRAITKKHDIPLSRSAFVGDGENDVPLLGVSGFFVAYQPKSQTLEAGADIVIRENGLHSLLEVFE